MYAVRALLRPVLSYCSSDRCNITPLTWNGYPKIGQHTAHPKTRKDTITSKYSPFKFQIFMRVRRRGLKNKAAPDCRSKAARKPADTDGAQAAALHCCLDKTKWRWAHTVGVDSAAHSASMKKLTQPGGLQQLRPRAPSKMLVAADA